MVIVSNVSPQGRKRAGGIRFGEMERDALIAHGTSFLLQDRLMNCSDYSTAWVCRQCGSLVSLGFDEVSGREGRGEYCRICQASGGQEKQMSTHPGVKQKDKREQVIVKGERKGDMDVIAVPCEYAVTLVDGRLPVYVDQSIGDMFANVVVSISLQMCSDT